MDYEDDKNIIPSDIKISRLGFLPKILLPARVKQQLEEVNYYFES